MTSATVRLTGLFTKHDVPWWAMAWYNPPTATIWIRVPFDRIFFAKARLMHEVAHHEGRDHHPWWHFCIRSPHAIRFDRHR